MEVAGYISALLIGISLGMIGGGGSILTVPVLVYLFGISPLTATSYSLFVVGSTSLVGSISSITKGLVDYRTTFLFGASSFLTVYLTRRLLLPSIPDLINVFDYPIPFSILLMILFSVLMLVSSIFMIRGDNVKVESTRNKSVLTLTIYGIGVGLITGFLGAGGGFLLIPALVLLLHLPMKKAVGTSLMLISLNSTIGFIADSGHFTTDWKLLFSISALAITGIFLGGWINQKIQQEKLKRGFGWFVLCMSVYIIVKELFL